MSDNDRCPTWNRGVPYCNQDRCPQYDGKRCRELGCRPSLICEPAVMDMASDRAAWAEERARMLSDLDRFRAEVHERLGVLERERDMARAERDGAAEERARLVAERDQARLDLGHEQDARARDIETASNALMSAHEDQLRAESERDALRAKLQAAKQERDEWKRDYYALSERTARAYLTVVDAVAPLTSEADPDRVAAIARSTRDEHTRQLMFAALYKSQRDAAITRAEALAKALADAADICEAQLRILGPIPDDIEHEEPAIAAWRALAASPDTTAPSEEG